MRQWNADVDTTATGTQVTWQPEELRRFFLLDVLLHELGHHRVQHEAGKRSVRTRRTADHEATAAAWAVRWRPVVRAALTA